MTNPDEIVEYNGASMRIRDIPDPFVREMLGMGHAHFSPDRKVITQDDSGPRRWPFTIQTCLYSGEQFATEWINNGQTLVCIGCGLDCT